MRIRHVLDVERKHMRQSSGLSVHTSGSCQQLVSFDSFCLDWVPGMDWDMTISKLRLRSTIDTSFLRQLSSVPIFDQWLIYPGSGSIKNPTESS